MSCISSSKEIGASRFPQNTLHESGPFGTVALVLSPTGMNSLFAAIADQFEASEIFEHRGPASAEYFDSLF